MIVIAVLWFGYWFAYALFEYVRYTNLMQIYHREGGLYEPDFEEVYGKLIVAFLFPALGFIVFATLRWIWRGFRG
jgi:hypothetical protein